MASGRNPMIKLVSVVLCHSSKALVGCPLPSIISVEQSESKFSCIASKTEKWVLTDCRVNESKQPQKQSRPLPYLGPREKLYPFVIRIVGYVNHVELKNYWVVLGVAKVCKHQRLKSPWERTWRQSSTKIEAETGEEEFPWRSDYKSFWFFKCPVNKIEQIERVVEG